MAFNFKVPLPKPSYIIQDSTLRTFDYSSIGKKDVIGQGSFGICYRSHYNGKDVVLKECLRKESDETRKMFLKEAKLLQEMNSKFVVKLHGVCFDPMSIMLEYLEFSFKSWNSDLKVSTVEEFLRLPKE